MEYGIHTTQAIKTITRLGVKNGLEPGEVTNVIKAWALKVERRIVGGIILIKVNSECTVEWLSINKKYRNEGWGKKLVNIAITEAKKKGFKTMVISMQIPDFFRKFGFYEVPMESVAKRFHCYDCSRFHKTCFPVVMKNILRREN